jgi:hypothetical protein
VSRRTDLKELLDFNPKRQGPDIWFKPRPGPGGKEEVYKARLMPPWSDDVGVPFHSEVMHYLGSFGDRNALSGNCPGDNCPACERFWKLRDVHKGDKEIIKTLRPLGPSRRLYCNVLDRRDEAIKVWSLPHGGDQSGGVRLLGLVQQYIGEELDLSDPVKGRDIMIPVADSGNGMRYGNFSIGARATKAVFNDEDLHDLRAISTSKVLSAEEIINYLPTSLGEHYEQLESDYQAALKGAPTSSSKGSNDPSTKLAGMTIKGLKELALEMDVSGTGNKAALIKRIKRAMG